MSSHSSPMVITGPAAEPGPALPAGAALAALAPGAAGPLGASAGPGGAQAGWGPGLRGAAQPRTGAFPSGGAGTGKASEVFTSLSLSTAAAARPRGAFLKVKPLQRDEPP